MKKSLVLAAIAASLLAGVAQAQDLPKTHLKVVGGCLLYTSDAADE